MVDGQQRLTTFQLFLAALRFVAAVKKQESIIKALDVYIFNDERSADADATPADRLKLVPTPADRSIFRDLLTEPYASIPIRHPDAFYKNGNIKKGYAPRALLAYLCFRDKIAHYADWGTTDPDEEQWLDSLLKEDPSDGLAGERLQALTDALLIQFKLVIISLEEAMTPIELFDAESGVQC